MQLDSLKSFFQLYEHTFAACSRSCLKDICYDCEIDQAELTEKVTLASVDVFRHAVLEKLEKSKNIVLVDFHRKKIYSDLQKDNDALCRRLLDIANREVVSFKFQLIEGRGLKNILEKVFPDCFKPERNMYANGPYHPASWGYKNVLQDGENKTVVVLGPEWRGLNPFYAFPGITNAIVVDLGDPSMFAGQAYDIDSEDEEVLDLDDVVITNAVRASLVQLAGNRDVHRAAIGSKMTRFTYCLKTSPDIQRTLTLVEKDFRDNEVIREVIDLAGEKKIAAMVHGSGAGGQWSRSIKLLVSEIKENRGVVVNESIWADNDYYTVEWAGNNFEAYNLQELIEFYKAPKNQLVPWKDGEGFSLIADFQSAVTKET